MRSPLLPLRVLRCLHLQRFQMELWQCEISARPKSNLLLKSKIRTLPPKHNLPAGQATPADGIAYS